PRAARGAGPLPGLRRAQAAARSPEPAAPRRRGRDDRRPDRGPLRARDHRAEPLDVRVALSALVVTVGVALGADEHDVAALTHALTEAGLAVTGRFAVDDDESALERALAVGADVTVVVTG